MSPCGAEASAAFGAILAFAHDSDAIRWHLVLNLHMALKDLLFLRQRGPSVDISHRIRKVQQSL